MTQLITQQNNATNSTTRQKCSSSKKGDWGWAYRAVDGAAELTNALICFPIFFEPYSIVAVFRQLRQKEKKKVQKISLPDFFLGGGRLDNDGDYDNDNRYY